jgi:UDP-N-acetylglucosamine 4,6-dehydratase
MGSRGSVIPFFLKFKDNGYLPITAPNMTRFWITLEQAVEFVLLCLNNMCGGELFVPKIPSMNIMDLARAVAPECETKIVGVRPGEKIHELMISRDDARQTLELDNFYVIQPQFNYWSHRSTWSEGRKVSDDFEYSSETNPWRLSITEMQEMLNKLG